MTEKTARDIDMLRAEGRGYRSIAAALSLPENRVKAWCRRHPLTDSLECVCPVCGNCVTQTPHKRKKKFCSDKCRYVWWASHPEERKKTAGYEHICPGCGKTFRTGRAESRYCCISCYAAARRKDTRDGG